MNNKLIKKEIMRELMLEKEYYYKTPVQAEEKAYEIIKKVDPKSINSYKDIKKAILIYG